MNQIFEPAQIGNLTLANRIVFAPTTIGEAAVEKYRQLAAAGTAMIVLPDVSVVPSMLKMPSLDSLDSGAYFKEVLDACHPYGCKVSAQLFHPEYDVDYIGGLYRQQGTYSREEIHRLLAENRDDYCDSLTTAQAEEIIGKFAVAAANAAAVGFDMIQIHGDRLVGSFSSALFNHRADYFAQRTVFAAEVVRAVRAAAPGLALEFKMTVRTELPCLGRGGVLLSEVGDFVPALEAVGIDSFHVAMANHSNIRDTIPAANHPDLRGEGCFLPLAREVKKYSTKPVCAVGKIQHPDFVRQVLDEGFAMVGLSRQLIADPLWVEKVRENRPQDIRYCVYCNAKCVSSIMTGKTVGCIFDKQ